jgi:transcriptional regulator with XRE-family HTH domain
MKTESINILNKLVSQESKWLQEATFREENESWLDRSAEIALMILRSLRSKGMTQKDLAEKLNVSAQQISKIAKGKENLTLETISKIENALEIELIEVSRYIYKAHYTPSTMIPYSYTEEKSTYQKIDLKHTISIYSEEEPSIPKVKLGA